MERTNSLSLLLAVMVAMVVVVEGAGNHKHPVPTFFRRTHTNNTDYIDAHDFDSFYAHHQNGYRLVVDDVVRMWKEEGGEERERRRQANDPVISVSPEVANNGDHVTVSWSGVKGATSSDWVGLYLIPYNTTGYVLDTHDYLDWYHVSNSPTYTEGYGSLDFQVYDLRANMQFIYYKTNGYNEAEAASNLLSFPPFEPLQAHLSLTSYPHEMRITWISNSTDQAFVMWGLESDELSNKKIAATTTYGCNDMCGAPATTPSTLLCRHPGYIHNVVMTGLDSKTTYFYKYGNDFAQSDVSSFQSAPHAREDITAVIYGDMGTYYDCVNCWKCYGAPGVAAGVLRDIANNQADLVLHNGDISYAVSCGYIWDMWQAMVEPIATKIPYMVGVGNHEYCHRTGGENDPSGAGNGFHPSWGNYGDDSYGECSVPLFHRFTMPGNGNALYWYSFNYGDVHFLQFSSEHDYTKGSLQWEWIREDLDRVDRSVTPWVVVLAHRPMYTSEKYYSDYKVSLNMRSNLEQLFLNKGVDIFIAGHYHSVERTCSVNNQTCMNDNPTTETTYYAKGGITHIVIGSAGIGLDRAGLYGYDWSIFFNNKDFGYGRLSSSSPTSLSLSSTLSLKWEFVQSESGDILDTFTLLKDE